MPLPAQRAGRTAERIVEAVGLTKVFSDFWLRAKATAVDAIDFHIERGEIFGLLGPNGSGKSTTIKMILGLLHRTRGRLSVLGREPSDVAVKRRIGYLPEESYMYRFLTPEETLDFYAKLFGLGRRERKRRVDELLEMVGLSGARHRAVGEFSKGMTRRLGLAQALINDPEFLILDEPTSGLDPVGTRQVKDLLLELGRAGKTILLSSHLLDEVEDVCDRMVILYGGKVRAAGTSAELLVDTSHTLLRTPRLSPETIAQVDELLHRLQQVGIDRVESPRERLEDFFMELVERARREAAATSGAQSGGKTAAFLVASEGGAGGELIETLVAGAPAPEVRAVETAAPTRAAGPAEDVLGELVRAKPPEAPKARETAEAPKAPEGVDASVIDDLLGGGEGRGKDSGR
jgi:ABC-2 type transport system ATP-binding protein